MKNFILISILFFSFFVCNSQTRKNVVFMGENFAKKELEIALSRQKQHNVLDNGKNLIEDSVIAIKVAEPILFNIYGKKHIIDEMPYEIYLIKNYWVIQGTLPENSKGGTFIIILNAKNAEVIKISHGK
jgi:hypothetical protein